MTRLKVLPDVLAIARLEQGSPIPRWAIRSNHDRREWPGISNGTGAPWFSITRTHEELSIVCAASAVPAGVPCEKPFRAIEVEGPLDFALTGILAGIAVPLAEAGISIFAISTFDTDYVLVRESALQEAVRVLRGAGYRIPLE